MKGEFSFPLDGYSMIGKDVSRWLKKLDFYSYIDEADRRRHENAFLCHID